MTIQNGRIPNVDLSRMIHNNNLSRERFRCGGGIFDGIAGYHTSLEVLDGDVLYVKANVVARDGLGNLVVMHLDGFDVRGDPCRSKQDMLTRRHDASFDSADWNRTDTSNLVYILQRDAKRFVDRALRGVDAVSDKD